MNKKIYASLLCIFAFITSAYAQTDIDGLRFSRTFNYGTARHMAMGGAFTALGGDITVGSYNPAGLGVFRRSQVVFTSAIALNQIKAGDIKTDKNSYQLGNLGAVFSMYNPDNDFRGITIGINYNNLNNFNHKLTSRNYSSNSSMLDAWVLEAGTTDSDQLNAFSTGLAYDAFLLEVTDDGYIAALGKDTPVFQQQQVNQSGYQGSYDISFAANVKDKFFMGFGIGIHALDYKSSSIYSEATDNKDADLNSFTYTKQQKNTGSGVNVKVGMLYTPVPEFRIAAAISSPTYYSITENYYTTISSNFKTTNADIDRNQTHYFYDSPRSHYNYKMNTPWTANVGIASIIGNTLIISLQYDFKNYQKMNYSDDNDSFAYDEFNRSFKQVFNKTHEFKAGVETRITPNFAFRAGYGYISNPFKPNYPLRNDLPFGREINNYSVGLGYSIDHFFFDAAFLYSTSKNTTNYYYAYLEEKDEIFESESAPIKQTYNDKQIRFTLGFRF